MLPYIAIAQTTDCNGSDPGGQPAASGLYAEYYRGYFNDDPGFFSDNNHPVGLTRTEANVNFATTDSFGDLLPLSDGTAQNPDRFSLRLRGSLNIATAGTYTFYLTADDAAYLWLDNPALATPPTIATALIDNGGTHVPVTRSVTLMLPAGRHNVLILYGDDCCDNTMVWEYEGPGIARQPVPSSVLCTAVLPQPPAPKSIVYSPIARALAEGSTRSSGVPTVNDGGYAVTNFALDTSTGSLPAGITIDAASGVLTADATVPQGTYDIDVAVSNANGTSSFRNVFRFQVTAPLPAGCGGNDAGGEPATAGLYAEYFTGYFNDNPAFFTNATPGLTRTEPVVNFATTESFGNLLGVAGGTLQNPDGFSLRLRGSLNIATAGTYTFYLTADDAAYLWLDNPALATPAVRTDATIDNGGFHPATTVAVTVTLSAGLHNFLLLYGDNNLANALQLEYESPSLGIARQVVPSALFCGSVQPAIPLVAALSYSPGGMRVVVNTSAASAMPAVSSASPVTLYTLANASTLPAGIAINSTTGQISVSNSVPENSYELDVAARNAGGSKVFADALTVQVIARPPAGCSGLDGGDVAASSGLYAEFFPGFFNDDIEFFNTVTPAQGRNVQVLNFSSTQSWGNLSGAASGTAQDPDEFSARFRGRINIATAGTYTFYLTSDDAAYLWLDNAALATTPTVASATIQNGGQHSVATVSATVQLSAGLHDMLVLYGEYVSGNVLRLEYASADAGVAQQLVPASGLCTTASNAPLPVTLTRFGVVAQNAGVLASWETAQELNSAYFVLERSANGRVFEAVGKVAAAGTTQHQQRYSYLDAAPLSGVAYYRLRQVDTDGTTSYSSVVSVVSKAAAGARAMLAPNPSHEAVTVRLELPAASPATLELLDVRGGVVLRRQLAAATTQDVALDLTTLPLGVYLCRITSASGVLTQRLVRE
ncbi:PA14 domain-containing protein [Hymenobacter pini]|uniref:PA14 domain-containing protein n=1 Tax=Hymenobacter pini TaxID=2880879 RepID=UPI001CF16BCB|nr:PA14 domain-containing protein [Hymenobacter pini]MCA8832321.1 putative Ig domain-containing protein [Hymenobacter pini]